MKKGIISQTIYAISKTIGINVLVFFYILPIFAVYLVT